MRPQLNAVLFISIAAPFNRDAAIPVGNVTIRATLSGEDGTIEDLRFDGHGCAISQAATSMLTEMVKGRSAAEVAALPRDELLDEIGIPLTPVRLKCALLGLSTLKLALHKAKGTPLPEEWAGASSDLELR